MRRLAIPCLVGGVLALAAACSANTKNDDDSAGASGDGSGGTSGGSGGKGGAGGGGGKAGTGATGGTGGAGGTGGTGGTGGSSGSAGASTQTIATGPFPYPQNKTPKYCQLTTVANASSSVQTIYGQWKTTYLVAGNPGLRVQRPENQNDTVSEGIGYGMLIAVYMNDQATFDGLWTYAQAHFDSSGLMNWHIGSNGATASMGAGSATDADEDMAFALIMASGQFNSPAYYAAGKKMAQAIISFEVAGDGMLKPGDGWGSSDTTYPDYFSPAYFRVFKTVSGSANWDIVIRRNYEILAKVTGTYGLVPDSTTGTTYDLSGSYKYDACRTPWRIGMDYCFNGTAEAKTYLDKIGAFFDKEGVANIGDGYTLTGTRTSSFGNMAFIGPAGIAGMSGFPKLLNDAFTYGATGNGGTSGYFQQTLRVVTMLVMSGNFVDYSAM